MCFEVQKLYNYLKTKSRALIVCGMLTQIKTIQTAKLRELEIFHTMYKNKHNTAIAFILQINFHVPRCCS